MPETGGREASERPGKKRRLRWEPQRPWRGGKGKTEVSRQQIPRGPCQVAGEEWQANLWRPTLGRSWILRSGVNCGDEALRKVRQGE